MSINIFDYWSFDPNGFIRHLLVGAVLSVLLLKINYRFVAAIIFSVALGKEFLDLLAFRKFFSFADVAFTVAPFLYFIFLNKYTNQ
jgi:hypothetical protein